MKPLLFTFILWTSFCWADALKFTCAQREALLVPRPKRAGFFTPPGNLRFGVGIIVVLEGGEKVMALGGATEVRHDELLATVEKMRRKKAVEYQWGGEVAMDNNGQVWDLGSIVQATPTSGYFHKKLGVKSDPQALKTAANRFKKGFWKVPPNENIEFNDQQKHLHPGMIHRHEIDNLTGPVMMSIEGLKSRLQEGDLGSYQEVLPAYRNMVNGKKEKLAAYYDLLRIDQVISPAEYASLTRKLDAFTGGGKMLGPDYDEWEMEMGLIRSRLDVIRNNLPQHITVLDIP